MNRFKLVILAIFIGISPGCAYLDARSSNLVEKIDALVVAQQYGHAREVLSRVSASHSDYPQVAALRKDIDKQAAAYEQLVLIKGENLEQQGQWYLAKREYRQALKNLPDSAKLKAVDQALSRKQEKRVAELELDLLIAQGEWLKQNLVIQKELALITPGNWLKESRRETLQKKSEKLAEELGREGKLAVERGELQRADQVLNAAMQLHPGAAIEETKKALVKKQETMASKQQQSRIQSQKYMRKKLLASMQQAMDQNQLSRASLYVTRLRLLGKLNVKEQQLAQQLELRVHKQVEDNMAQGVEYYGLGQYKQAISSWQSVLELEPDNEQAAEHIERAERILEKLQRLREDKAE